MKRFKFSLDRLQRVRNLHEIQARAAYAEAAARVSLLAEELRSLQARAAQIQLESATLRAGTSLDLQAELASERVRAGLTLRMAAVTADHATAQQAAEAAQAAWNGTRQDQRSLERLKERQRDSWRGANEAAEITETDEGTSARFESARKERDRE